MSAVTASENFFFCSFVYWWSPSSFDVSSLYVSRVSTTLFNESEIWPFADLRIMSIISTGLSASSFHLPSNKGRSRPFWVYLSTVVCPVSWSMLSWYFQSFRISWSSGNELATSSTVPSCFFDFPCFGFVFKGLPAISLISSISSWLAVLSKLSTSKSRTSSSLDHSLRSMLSFFISSSAFAPRYTVWRYGLTQSPRSSIILLQKSANLRTPLSIWYPAI